MSTSQVMVLLSSYVYQEEWIQFLYKIQKQCKKFLIMMESTPLNQGLTILDTTGTRLEKIYTQKLQDCLVHMEKIGIKSEKR